MATIRAPLNTPDKETVYAPDGAQVVTTRLNAMELVRYSGFSWKKPTGTETAIPVEVVAEPVAEASEVFSRTVEAEEPVTPVDPEKDALAEVAEALTGNGDARKYLEGFSADALRTIAEKRYGEKIHHRTAKDRVIDRIIALETEKIAAESYEE